MAHAIEEYPVPLIFRKIFKEALSGELTVTGENFSKKLYFSKGLLLFASTNLKRERLGEMLVREGKIKKKQFLLLTQEMKKTGSRFGKILVDNNVLTRQGLYNALREQVKAIALSIFPLTSGKWGFIFGSPEIPGGQNFEIPLPELMVEGIDRLPGFSYFKGAFNYKTPETLPVPESTGQLLSDDRMRFYLKLATCPNLTSAEILVLMKLPEAVFWRSLVLLYLLDIMDFAEFKAERRLNLDTKSIDVLLKKMKHDKSDHRDPLDLGDTESVSRVSDKYFSFAEAPPEPEKDVDFAIVDMNPDAVPKPPTGKDKKKSRH